MLPYLPTQRRHTSSTPPHIPALHNRICVCVQVRFIRPGGLNWESAPPPELQPQLQPQLQSQAEECSPLWWHSIRRGDGERGRPIGTRDGTAIARGNASAAPAVLRLRLHAPSVLWDPLGRLPTRSGRRTQHLALYYHMSLSFSASNSFASAAAANSSNSSNTSLGSCVGRLTARWAGLNATCTPLLDSWQDRQLVGRTCVCEYKCSPL